MFTDGPTTPRRLETLVDLLRGIGSAVNRDTVIAMLEPDGLPGKTANTLGAAQTLRAAAQLGLIREEVLVALTVRGTSRASDVVIEALDREVLCKADPEPYFALFYAYMLGVESDAAARVVGDRGAKAITNEQWAKAFNRDVFDEQRQSNPFNKDKISGLNRWLAYAGLGWFDPSEHFQCCPYDRVRRRLPIIFARDARLEDDEFMRRLAQACPELDDGDLFRRAHRAYDAAERSCTPGLSRALVELHLDGAIRLHCGDDSVGWSLRAAEPPVDGTYFRTDRLDYVELLRPAAGTAR